MWSKIRPTEPGWYWVIIKNEEIGVVCVIIPVAKLENGELQFSFGDDVYDFASEEIETIKYWDGPMDEPAIFPEIEEEIGKVQMLA